MIWIVFFILRIIHQLSEQMPVTAAQRRNLHVKLPVFFCHKKRREGKVVVEQKTAPAVAAAWKYVKTKAW